MGAIGVQGHIVVGDAGAVAGIERGLGAGGIARLGLRTRRGGGGGSGAGGSAPKNGKSGQPNVNNFNKGPAMKDALAELASACRGDHRPDCPILRDLAGMSSTPSHPEPALMRSARTGQRFAGHRDS